MLSVSDLVVIMAMQMLTDLTPSNGRQEGSLLEVQRIDPKNI